MEVAPFLRQATSPWRGGDQRERALCPRSASAERRTAIRGERRRGAGGGAERLALFLGGDCGGIGAKGLRRAVVRTGARLVEREIGRGMLGGVGLRAQEDREQRPAETDRGGADRQRVEAERLGLGGLVRLGLGHGDFL
jgi:hypothetical protein